MNGIYIQLISALFSSVIFLVLYLGVLPIIDSIWKLNLSFHEKRMTDTFGWIICILGTVSTGIVFYLHFLEMGWPVLILTIVLLIAMALITVCDYKKQLVPNKIIIILLAIWSLIMIIFLFSSMEVGMWLLSQSLLGGLIAGLTFLLCYVLSKKQLGAGDVKIAFIMGLYLTSSRVVAGIFYGVVICCVFSIVQLCRKKMNMKSGLPLVPFLYLGTVIAYILL